MKIFQSSLSYKTFELIDKCTPGVKINLLRSFGLDDNQTLRIIEEFEEYIETFILDSGVWSKNQNPDKVKHTVYDYGEFLKQHGNKFYCYFNYDEDFNEVEKDDFSSRNWENQKILEDMGLNPVPVLHSLSENDLKYLAENNTRYPMVAIGSNAIRMTNFRQAVKYLYDANIRVHAFRIGSAEELKGLHAWSSDCSSHAQWTMAGRCVFYDDINDKDTSISFRPFNKKNEKNADYYHRHPLAEKFRWFVEEFVGIEFYELIRDSNCRTLCNSIYFWWLEKYVSEYNFKLKPPEGPITFQTDSDEDFEYVANLYSSI